MDNPKLKPLEGQKYICLETFKKNGEGVKTPVWFVLHNGAFYIYTEADSWKVKRVRNKPQVRIAPCDIRGNVNGEWVGGTAQLIDGEERWMADKLLDKKYFLKKIFNFMTKIKRHERAMIKIEVK